MRVALLLLILSSDMIGAGYWSVGQPFSIITGDGTQTYWSNGLPVPGMTTKRRVILVSKDHGPPLRKTLMIRIQSDFGRKGGPPGSKPVLNVVTNRKFLGDK